VLHVLQIKDENELGLLSEIRLHFDSLLEFICYLTSELSGQEGGLLLLMSPIWLLDGDVKYFLPTLCTVKRGLLSGD